jgi:hypothetical protein
MFEKASRLKLRFESPKGLLSVEDLWDLPLTSTRNGANLNDLAKAMNRELKASAEEDFVNQTATADSIIRTLLQLRFDIVKHIINVRLAENAAAKAKADAKEKKDRILAIIERKQNEKLEGASLEDLQKMVAEL